MANIPTAKTIMKTGCLGETALTIRRILDGRLDPKEASGKCRRWAEKCLHTPSLHEQQLRAIDDLLGNYGVESVESKEYYQDEGVLWCPRYSYSNTGETYAVTIVRDHKNSRWLIAAWGDLAEKEVG